MLCWVKKYYSVLFLHLVHVLGIAITCRKCVTTRKQQHRQRNWSETMATHFGVLCKDVKIEGKFISSLSEPIIIYIQFIISFTVPVFLSPHIFNLLILISWRNCYARVRSMVGSLKKCTFLTKLKHSVANLYKLMRF